MLVLLLPLFSSFPLSPPSSQKSSIIPHTLHQLPYPLSSSCPSLPSVLLTLYPHQQFNTLSPTITSPATHHNHHSLPVTLAMSYILQLCSQSHYHHHLASYVISYAYMIISSVPSPPSHYHCYTTTITHPLPYHQPLIIIIICSHHHSHLHVNMVRSHSLWSCTKWGYGLLWSYTKWWARPLWSYSKWGIPPRNLDPRNTLNG
jgi:hypothetical protein